MAQIKYSSVLILLLITACDVEIQPTIEKDEAIIEKSILVPVKKEIIRKPPTIDLSLPNSTIFTPGNATLSANEPYSLNELNINLNKKFENNYNISGDFHIDPNENNDELLLNKIDGGRINIEIKFK